MHDNIVRFRISKVKDLEFKYIEHEISNGKHLDTDIKTKLSKDGLEWNMCIKADRHGSDSVAKWFKDQITNYGTQSGAAIGCDTYDAMPGSLNFAVKGDLIATEPDGHKITIPNIIIAQGNNARSRNNWWIGGADLENAVDIKLLAGLVKEKAIAYEHRISIKERKLEYMVFYPASGENIFNVTHI